MSIIYDALKKVEKATQPDLPREGPLNLKPKSKITLYVIYLLIIGVGVVMAKIIFDFVTPPAKTTAPTQAASLPRPKEINPPLPVKTTEPSQETQKPEEVKASDTTASAQKETGSEYQTDFVLNGVFFSEGQGYALINNQITKIGDVVDGATVLNISIDGVELKWRDETLKISTRTR